MHRWRQRGGRGEDGGEEPERGAMTGEVHVEERTGDFESDVGGKLGVEGGLEGSRNESLRVGYGAEGGNIFHCHVKGGLFDMRSKECAEASFHDPDGC
jgi:hypothetical protein